MKKITGFMLVLCAALNAALALAGENPPLPQIESPVLITGFGQSQDTNNVNIICRRLKVNAEYKLDVPSAEIDWSRYKTLFAVLGCSSSVYCCAFDADSTAIVITRDGKPSPTVSGLSILDEAARCSEIIEGARAHGVKVIAMHIGAAAARQLQAVSAVCGQRRLHRRQGRRQRRRLLHRPVRQKQRAAVYDRKDGGAEKDHPRYAGALGRRHVLAVMNL